MITLKPPKIGIFIINIIVKHCMIIAALRRLAEKRKKMMMIGSVVKITFLPIEYCISISF